MNVIFIFRKLSTKSAISEKRILLHCSHFQHLNRYLFVFSGIRENA